MAEQNAGDVFPLYFQWLPPSKDPGESFFSDFDNNYKSQYLLNSYYVPQVCIISFNP